MSLEDLIAQVDRLEDKIESSNKSLSVINSRINEVDERTTGFLEIVREEKKEVARLNSIVMGLGQFDAAIAQVRVDFKRKMDEFLRQRKQEEQLRTNLIDENIRATLSEIEKAKKDLTVDFDKKLTSFLEENNRLLIQLRELESEARERLSSSEAFESMVNVISQDLRRTIKQVENLQADSSASKNAHDEMRSKLEVITNSLRTNESRLNELISTETERRQLQIDFIEKQSVNQNDKDRIWGEWEETFQSFSKQVSELLPELQNQQLGLKQSKDSYDEITRQFDRRINELTEMYRLMEDKFKKEWTTFKSDTEKSWSNISMIIDDKQGGYADQLQTLKDRTVLVEDNMHEMQEILLLMSSEIQKGMQNLMKMVNGWMGAFGQIKKPK